MLVWIVHLEDAVHVEIESGSCSSQVGTDGHSAATNDLVAVIRSNFKQIVFNPLCLRLASLSFKKFPRWTSVQFSSVQSLSRVQLFATPWIAIRQASLSTTSSWSSLKLMSIESVMPSSHLILCRPLSSCPQSLPASESFPMSQLFRTYFYPNMRVLKVNILRKSHLSNYMFLCLIKHMFLKFNKNLGTWGILITPFISQFVINSTHVVWGFSVSLQRVTSP